MLAAIMLIMTLASCSFVALDKDDKDDKDNKVEETEKDEGKKDEKYVRGTSDASGWTSEWLGIKFVPDSTMVMSTASEIEAMMEIDSNAIMKDESGKEFIDYAKVVAVYEMMATAVATGDNVIVMTEKLALVNTTVEQYVDAFKSSFDKTIATDMVFTDTSAYTLCGVELTKLGLDYTTQGIKVNQTYLFGKQGDRIVGFIFTNVSEGAFEKMTGMFAKA